MNLVVDWLRTQWRYTVLLGAFVVGAYALLVLVAWWVFTNRDDVF